MISPTSIRETKSKKKEKKNSHHFQTLSFLLLFCDFFVFGRPLRALFLALLCIFFFSSRLPLLPTGGLLLSEFGIRGKERERMKSFNDFLLPQERKLKEKSEGKNKGRERGRVRREREGERGITRWRKGNHEEERVGVQGKVWESRGCLDKPNIQLI